jgi:hypothetical protein
MKHIDQDGICAMAQNIHDAAIQLIINQAIPVYTRKKPNPKSGKPDCPITTREKEHFRYVMKMKLQAAKTDEERQKVIDHYKTKWSE